MLQMLMEKTEHFQLLERMAKTVTPTFFFFNQNHINTTYENDA